jgi:hypothetical protein
VPPDDEQVVLKTCRGCQFVINCKQKVHLVGPTILIYYDAQSTKHQAFFILVIYLMIKLTVIDVMPVLS